MGKLMINGEQYPAIVVKAGLDDTQTRKDATWSSDKINEELEDVRSELDIIVEEANKNTSINDEVESLTTVWSSKKTSDEIAKHSLPLAFDSGIINNSTVQVYKLANVGYTASGGTDAYNLNLLLSSRGAEEIELIGGKNDGGWVIEAIRNNKSFNKITNIYQDGLDIYVRLDLRCNYFRVYHKSGVLSGDFAVSLVDTVPESATELTINSASIDDTKSSTTSTYSSAKIDELNANRQVKVFKNSGSTAKYYKICSAITAGYPYNIKATTGRIDSTVSVEYFSAIFRDSRYNYTSQVVLDGRFAYNQSVSTYKEYCPCFIVDANQDLYLYVPSYSQTTIEIDTRAITIDGTEGTPIEDYVYNSFDHRFDERINDSGTTSTTSTWSSSKIASTIDNKFLVGTSAPTTDTCPVGCFYGVYEE